MPIATADKLDDREPATRDAAAVAAVLRGETVNYRELVERYERLVYAVTWSCLGDATMAEDAAQEAFIRAYRSLPLLGNGAKFSAWVTTIARNTAISLGMKQRRELNNRTRWALEQPAVEPPAATAEEACTPDMLREALEELSAEHRESLVLFYLEGKRGAEVAAALGISEAALRMRLLRARAALRERLEARLGESLAQLQPRHSLTPGVMGVVLSSSTAKAGGGTTAGTALLATLGKVLPFKVALSFVPLLAAWGVAGAWSSRRGLEKFARNLRDPDGVHAKMFHRIIQKKTWLDLFWANIKHPIFLGLIWAALMMIGDRTGGVILASFFLLLLVKIGRLLPINRSRDVKSLAIYLVLLILLCLQGAFPPEGRHGFTEYHLWEVWFVWTIWESVDEMSGMDVNLFMFDLAGFLPGGGEGAVVGRLEERLSSAELLEFARYLGEGGMVNDFRWVRPGEELMLRAGALPSSFLFAPVNFLLQGFRWQQWSWISLKADGTVSAHCTEAVARHASEETEQEINDLGAVEQRVASAVEAAWRIFRVGYFNQAGRILGNFPLAEVLLKPPAPSWTWPGLLMTFLVVFAICMVGSFGVMIFSHNDERMIALFYFMVSWMGLVISAVLWALTEAFRRR